MTTRPARSIFYNMERISENISWNEAITSPTATKLGILNVPDAATIANMKFVAENIFEKVRAHLRKPIKVTSFYRSPALNVAIGGSKTSQHCKGEALDMDGDVYGVPSNVQIFEFIRDHLVFDQLIIEGITNGKIAWVHCSAKKSGNRGQILFMYQSGGRKVYEPYSEARYKQLVNTSK